MTFRSLLPAILLSLVLTTTRAQVPEPSLGSTAAGRRVRDYLTAFNSGNDSTVRAFFQRNLAGDPGQSIPLERRIERYREMRSMAGSLTLKRILELRNDLARVFVDARNGPPLTMTFECEAVPPHGLRTIRVEQSQPEEEGVEALKNDSSLVAHVDGYLRTLADADAFSGVVLVAKRGTPLFQKAYRFADVEKKIPNTPATRFNLGSINKSFTQVAIYQLAAQGKLSLSDPIKKFLPDYPNTEAASKVTVQHLLDMSSGVGDFFNERYEATPKKSLNTIRGYLPLFADKPLAFEPGTNRRYSNGGYIVLGAIIEQVSGMDYYTYVRTNIFAPAGMSSSDWYDKDSLPSDAAIGSTRGDRPAQNAARRSNHDGLPQRGSSAGGGYSNAEDLLRYTRALAESPVIPSTYQGRGGLGIAGGTEGVNAALEWDPDNGYAIVVLSNYDPPAAEKVARRIRAWLPKK